MSNTEYMESLPNILCAFHHRCQLLHNGNSRIVETRNLMKKICTFIYDLVFNKKKLLLHIHIKYYNDFTIVYLL